MSGVLSRPYQHNIITLCVSNEHIYFTHMHISLKEFFISSAKEILLFVCLTVFVSEQNISNLDSRLLWIVGKLDHGTSDSFLAQIQIKVQIFSIFLKLQNRAFFSREPGTCIPFYFSILSLFIENHFPPSLAISRDGNVSQAVVRCITLVLDGLAFTFSTWSCSLWILSAFVKLKRHFEVEIEWEVSIITESIAMKFGTHICVPLRINRNNFNDHFTFQIAIRSKFHFGLWPNT